MRYVILRDLARRKLRGPSEGTFGQYDYELSDSSPVPSVEVETADAQGLADLGRDPKVRAFAAVMPTRLIEPLPSPSSDEGSVAWGVSAVGASDSPFNGAATVVAVLDTGIDAGHEAFAGMTLVENDFSGDGNGDRHGHGTHCAGTFFGRDTGGRRIGVARGVRRALIGKVLRDSGGGGSDAIALGLQWAVSRGAHVVSMSLGLDFPGMAAKYVTQGWPTDLATSAALEAYRANLRLLDALMAMIRAQEGVGSGCVVVAAAGNESRRDVRPDYEIAASLPAAADGVLSVGAVRRSPHGYTLAPFSNAFPVLCAPGVDVVSARAGGGLHAMSGTSMACPHAAGVAALWWEASRERGLPVTARIVSARILASCHTRGLESSATAAGYGSGLITAPSVTAS